VWIKTRHYPYRARSGSYGYDALIGVGGNLGDTVGRLERLFGYWQRTRQLWIVQTSPILRNPPFGYVDQPDFYNALIHVRSALDPHALLRYLLYTEKRFGRVRSFANAPRTLDLDLIFYDARTIRSARLQVPHPFWCTRRSVVWPLAQMKGLPW
jgi:2-amino-4-hydroxy-6-hydroxymethyldihydropteridine diphosphokinase